MNLYEAAKLAIAQNGEFARPGFQKRICARPTESAYHRNRCQRNATTCSCPGWTPKAEDLIADDWQVFLPTPESKLT